jgi:Cu2+-exporting ATPase
MALGNKKLMEQVSAKVSDELENQIIAEQKTGKTVSYISVDNCRGFVSITDAIKATSVEIKKN